MEPPSQKAADHAWAGATAEWANCLSAATEPASAWATPTWQGVCAGAVPASPSGRDACCKARRGQSPGDQSLFWAERVSESAVMPLLRALTPLM